MLYTMQHRCKNVLEKIKTLKNVKNMARINKNVLKRRIKNVSPNSLKLLLIMPNAVVAV